MTDLRQAAQMALDALEGWWDNFPESRDLHDKVAITALRKALEQQAEALQAMNDQLTTGTSIMLDGKRVDPASVYKKAEPVAAESITDAMMNLVDRLGSEWKQVDLRAWQHLLVYAPQQQAEPVGEVIDERGEVDYISYVPPVGTALYTASPQQQAKPVQEPFDDLATELFVVAQISPADDGFSDTIDRIESWLQKHFSTQPQRKPLTDELEAAFKDGWQSAKAAHCIKEGT